MSLTAHDYNKDGRVDILVGVNNGKFEAFTNQSKGESYALRLPDYSNGRTYIGAKISIFYKNKGVQLHELYAGSGYLSQSAPIVFIGSKKTIQKIAIQWPDGRAQEIDTLKISERLSLN